VTVDPSLAQAAMTRLAELNPYSDGRVITSDLSVSEFLLVKQAGFRPLGLVLGASIYHVGVQADQWTFNQELDVVSQAMYEARELAMKRMQAEAARLGADGIVGVRLTVEFEERASEGAEFLAMGTAVKADDDQGWRTDAGRPFTSDLSGQDFWALLQAGYAPLGRVMGVCVYQVARRTVADIVGGLGLNAELSSYTRALYDARERAMARMRAEAEALNAEGIVGVQLDQRNHAWGSHTTEFFAIGTAVRPIRPDHEIARPRLALSLDT
jgi:uncharacterized protein YbjQ (UPF0145 family)